MRKFSKGAAITGGIFCIISLVVSLISMLVNIANYSRMGISNMIPTLLTSNIPGLLVFILLAIVLFRRRADVFAAVIFILAGIYALVNVVSVAATLSVITNGGMSPVPYVCGMAGNLIRGIVYILMAVHCFRKNAGKTPLYGIGFILVAILSIANSVTLLTSNGVFYGDTTTALITIIPMVIGGIIGALPLILVGFAVGNAKADAPVNPADPYGLYAQYGMQPPVSTPDSQSVIDSYQAQYQPNQQNTWQQPQYQPNQQSWQQPQYQPNQQNSWQQPQYQAPQQQSWQQPQ